MREVGTYIPNYSQDERMFPPDTWTARNQTKSLRQTESLQHFTRRNIKSYIDMDDDITDPKDETYGTPCKKKSPDVKIITGGKFSNYKISDNHLFTKLLLTDELIR